MPLLPVSNEVDHSHTQEANTMRRYRGWALVFALALMAWGCNKTDQTEKAGTQTSTKAQADDNQKASAATADDPTAKLDGPKLTVYHFLDALRKGDDEKANSLLTPLAREKTAAMDYRLTPTASDNARFTIDSVDYVGDDGARVAMTWTDVDGAGNPTSDKAVWVLRKEAEGWRVVGTAAIFFPGEEPVVLNFENPAEVKKKLEEVSVRMNQMSEPDGANDRQAEQNDQPDDAVRR
jgi:hypothetical protein